MTPQEIDYIRRSLQLHPPKLLEMARDEVRQKLADARNARSFENMTPARRAEIEEDILLLKCKVASWTNAIKVQRERQELIDRIDRREFLEQLGEGLKADGIDVTDFPNRKGV